MFFKLLAPSESALKLAYFEADTIGLDPESNGLLTIDIGTGNIEKVSRLVEKFNLSVLSESDYEPTSVAYRGVRNV
jgi:hypothetical protein